MCIRDSTRPERGRALRAQGEYAQSARALEEGIEVARRVPESLCTAPMDALCRALAITKARQRRAAHGEREPWDVGALPEAAAAAPA